MKLGTSAQELRDFPTAGYVLPSIEALDDCSSGGIAVSMAGKYMQVQVYDICAYPVNGTPSGSSQIHLRRRANVRRRTDGSR